MMPIVFYFLAKAFQSPGTPCSPCTFVPWVVLVLVYTFCAAHRSAERLCSDYLRIGIHVTAVALLYTQAKPLAYACSVFSLLFCARHLATDVASTCAFSLAAVVALPFLCPYALDAESQLSALVWAEAVDIVYYVASRLI